ncbi:uncharacterized protein LOC141910631, partial [Tubulanus polymorphus]|uniref:uncharacterized protein LOC141910631 n=1 Tax=Tubulanus polymorphus TaxID=672921 RepID=UPI003DA43018
MAAELNDKFNDCVFDLCEMYKHDPSINFKNLKEKVCGYMKSAEFDCESLNFQVENYRTAHFCPITCPEGATYMQTMSSCEKTCVDPKAITCSKRAMNVSGCQCDDGGLKHEERCYPSLKACPVPKNCPPGQTVGKDRKICEDKCKADEGKVYDSVTGNCKELCNATEGWVLNKEKPGHCISSCNENEGETWNEKIEECVGCDKANQGLQWNKKMKKCIFTCNNETEIWSKSNQQCEPKSTTTTPTGTTPEPIEPSATPPAGATTEPSMKPETVNPGAVKDQTQRVKGETCKTTTEGQEYRGHLDRAKSGRKCQAWNSQSPHKHTRYHMLSDRGTASNYCRNPDNEPEGPWCYTVDPDTRWEYCDIGFCPGTAPVCKTTKKGREYQGLAKTTRTGLKCQ